MKQWTSPGDIYHPNHTNNYKNVYTGLIIVSPKLSYSVTGSDPVFRCSCVNWYSWWYLLGPRIAVHHITLFKWHYKYDCDKNEYRVINYHILYGVFPMDMMSHAILLYFCLVIECVEYNSEYKWGCCNKLLDPSYNLLSLQSNPV